MSSTSPLIPTLVSTPSPSPIASPAGGAGNQHLTTNSTNSPTNQQPTANDLLLPPSVTFNVTPPTTIVSGGTTGPVTSTTPIVPSSTSPILSSSHQSLDLPTAVASSSSSPQQVQSARGPAPSARQSIIDSSTSASGSLTTSHAQAAAAAAHRRSVTSAGPLERIPSNSSTTSSVGGSGHSWDWPQQQQPAISQPAPLQRSSSTESNASNSGGAGSGPAPATASSFSPQPLLHDLPVNEPLYMTGLLTKKGRNLGFGLGFWRTTRLYVLTDTSLSFTDKSKKNIKRTLLVENMKSVVRLQSRRWPMRCFTLRFEDDTLYHLRAPTAPECTDWIDALTKAILNAEKRKAMFRFMRDNAQMQQMQQMAQIGSAYGQLPYPALQQQAAIIQQQQQQLDAMGMMQMPMNPQMLQMAQMQQMAQMGYPMAAAYQPPYVPAMPLQYVPVNVPLPDSSSLNANSSPMPNPLSRIKSRSRSNPKEAGGGVSLSRPESKSRSNKAKEAAVAAAAASGSGAGTSGSDVEPGGTTDEEEFGSADEFAASGEDVEAEEGDEYYDEEPYYAPLHQYPFDPFAAAQAAAFASWQQQSSANLFDHPNGVQFNPEEQPSLNKQKDQLHYFFIAYLIISGLILFMGHENYTGLEILAVVSRLFGFGGSSSSMFGSSSSSNSTVGVSSSFGMGMGGVDVGSIVSLLVHHWNLVLFVISFVSSIYFHLKFKKHKKKSKLRQQAQKKEAAAAKSANYGKLPSATEQAANQAKWKEESQLLQRELEQNTRLMTRLGVSVAIMVGCAAHIYRNWQ